MSRRGATALAAVLALGVPAPALAQSAGDDQYRDPFAGGEGQQREQTGADGGGSGGGSPTAPAPANPAPAPSQTPASAPSANPSEPVATTAGELPRTGSEAIWIAALGVLLVAAGVHLRRTAEA